MSDIWLESLATRTPQEGYDLAIRLSRMAVKMTQPDAEIPPRSGRATPAMRAA